MYFLDEKGRKCFIQGEISSMDLSNIIGVITNPELKQLFDENQINLMKYVIKHQLMSNVIYPKLYIPGMDMGPKATDKDSVFEQEKSATEHKIL